MAIQCLDSHGADARAKHTALAGKAFDLAQDLSFKLKSYRALELFVLPQYTDEQDASVGPSRTDLGAMLHTLNIEVQRQMRALIELMAELHAQTTTINPPHSAAPSR